MSISPLLLSSLDLGEKLRSWLTPSTLFGIRPPSSPSESLVNDDNRRERRGSTTTFDGVLYLDVTPLPATAGTVDFMAAIVAMGERVDCAVHVAWAGAAVD